VCVLEGNPGIPEHPSTFLTLLLIYWKGEMLQHFGMCSVYMCARIHVYRRIREGGIEEIGYFPNSAYVLVVIVILTKNIVLINTAESASVLVFKAFFYFLSKYVLKKLKTLNLLLVEFYFKDNI
jgi:hypothetical protein